MYEIILNGIFDIKIKISTGPNIALFNQFQQTWSRINKLNFASVINDNIVYEKINNKGEDILKCVMESLKDAHQKEDYREL
jgi:hypothetical protein